MAFNFLGGMSLADATGIDIDFFDLEGSKGITNTERAFPVLGAAGAALGLFDRDSPTNILGYQGTVPDYTLKRQRVPNTYASKRRPGSGGQRYFTSARFVPTEDYVADPADTVSADTAAGLAALNLANLARQERFTTKTEAPVSNVEDSLPASSVIDLLPVPTYDEQGNTVAMAKGGIANLAKGRYLSGNTDGMADKIPANIDGVQEARLSDGEFVIPADVVSHLGNGNSDAGAKVLTDMMRRVRKQRTGNEKQGKEINPRKFLPA